MNRNAGLSTGIIALLALAAHLAVPTGHERGSGNPAEQGGKAETRQSKKGAEPKELSLPPYEGPWMATRHFFPSDAPLPNRWDSTANFKNLDAILKCENDANCLTELRKYFGPLSSDPVKCVLALVPDPYHTRLALFADRTIDAIEKGAAAAEWEFVAQWLPWQDKVDPDEGDPAKRAQERQEVRVQERQPGVLIFRHAPALVGKGQASRYDWEKGALVVFVVGETPTAGVNPIQFQFARAYMKALDPSDEVGIDGPTFSGSFYSLADLILQDKGRQPGKEYQVESGTATSPHAAQAFRERAGVDFHSATENLQDQDRHFDEVLAELHIDPRQAAVLAEDESAFGGAASSADPSTDPSKAHRVFRYPRDISHLRDAYRQAIQASQSDKMPASNLDFSLKDPNVGEDSVPTYSQTQTPLSQNGVINEITRAIAREDIRMVEVSATNVLDLLFLAGVLRRQCPDTRLLIQIADLLFVQAEQTQPLAGTLFLASYPLFAESRVWEGRADYPIFSDTLSEGAFNATVLLLADQCKREKLLADYAWVRGAHPPAWLLTLDRRGFTPVKVWDAEGKDANKSEPWFDPVPINMHPDYRGVASPRIWKVLSNAFALLGIAIGFWILELWRRKDWVVDARFEPVDSENSWHGFYLFLFLLILIGIQIVIRLARPLDTDPPSLILTLFGCGIPAWIAAKVGIRHCQPEQKRRMAMWGAVGTVLAGVVLWGFCCIGEESRSPLFSFRAAELRLGSSPLWPIVAASVALLVWCFVHMTRLYSAFREQPEVITSGVERLLEGRLKTYYDHFSGSARSTLGLSNQDQRSGFKIALAVFGGLAVLCRVCVQLGSIDGRTYDSLCIPLQLLVSGLLLLTCWHILYLWRSLHSFTTCLDILPLARNFIQVSSAGGRRPIWVRRFSLQSLDIYTTSVLFLNDMGLQLEQLWEYGLGSGRVNRWQTLYRNRIDGALRLDPPRPRQERADEHRKLWRFRKLVARQMWRLILKSAWRSEPLAGDVIGAQTSASKKQATDEDDTTTPTQRPKIAGNPKKVVNLAEAFVALHYSSFVLYGLRQIKNLSWFVSVGFVLLVFSTHCYNFQAPQWIGRFLLILFIVISCILGTCMVEIERDPILSRIAGTKPGELNTPFYLKLARYGALPILGLLASLFPSVSNLLFSLFEPALEALK